MSDEDMSYMPNTTGNTNCGFPTPAHLYMGNVSWQDAPAMPRYAPPPVPAQIVPPLTADRVREIFIEMLADPAFREAIGKVLEEDARQIRENRAFQPTKQAGTCCACLTSGDDMVWVGHRLAHKTDECRRKAAEMEPVREHRG